MSERVKVARAIAARTKPRFIDAIARRDADQPPYLRSATHRERFARNDRKD